MDEGGTAPALAAAVNAIVDALSGHGVTHMEMPITAESVWKITHRGSQAITPGGSTS